MEPAARLTQLEIELIAVRKELGLLAAAYDPKSSSNHNSSKMNELIRRMRHIHTNINQERQKLCTRGKHDPETHNPTSQREMET